jgi:hypothetical protein
MSVCAHHGLVFAILTRDQHCPPHVHVGTDKWEARFEFGFWDNGVRQAVVSPSARRTGDVAILSAHFETRRYRTTLILVSGDQVEIQL